MRAVLSVFRRELAGYFVTPVAYVFIVIFLILTGVFTFADGLGQFYERGQADLRSFFTWHPWLYLFLIPAVSMRVWAEERRQGTIELLMTLPLAAWQAVLGKYLAAWAFTGVALAPTFPVWITVNMLGEPDHGAIIAGYVGSYLMAGALLAIGTSISAITRSQVIAFVLTTVAGFVLLLAGFPAVQSALEGWMPAWLQETIAGFSFLTRFESLAKGVIAAPDIVYFLSLIGVLLIANSIVVELKKAS